MTLTLCGAEVVMIVTRKAEHPSVYIYGLYHTSSTLLRWIQKPCAIILNWSSELHNVKD